MGSFAFLPRLPSVRAAVNTLDSYGVQGGISNDSAGSESNSSLPNRPIISSAYFKTWTLLMENTLHTSSVCRPQYKHTISFVWHLLSQSIAKCRWQSSLAALGGRDCCFCFSGREAEVQVRSEAATAVQMGFTSLIPSIACKHRNSLHKKLQFSRARLQSLGHPGLGGLRFLGGLVPNSPCCASCSVVKLERSAGPLRTRCFLVEADE